MITFADFSPGKIMGAASVDLDQPLIDQWLQLYPEDEGVLPNMPEGMASVLVMRAYMEILSPRPPGNVHAGQSFKLRALPVVGSRVTTEMTCASKELRRDRRWVDVETTSRSESGDKLFTGRMTLIWAA